MVPCTLANPACSASDAVTPTGACTRVQLLNPHPYTVRKRAIHLRPIITGTIRMAHPRMRAPLGTSGHRLARQQRIVCRASGDPTMDLTINEERWKKQVWAWVCGPGCVCCTVVRGGALDVPHTMHTCFCTCGCIYSYHLQVRDGKIRNVTAKDAGQMLQVGGGCVHTQHTKHKRDKRVGCCM